jgi:hypothetical protein
MCEDGPLELVPYMSPRLSWNQYWQELLAENGAAKPGWVALLLFPSGLSNAGLVALQRCLLNLLGTGAARYVGLFHVAPSVFGEDVDRQITSTMQELGAPSTKVQLDVIGADAESLAKLLTAMPKRSIVVVHHLELFYSPGTAQSASPIHTWSGAEVSVGTLDERHGAQLGALVERLLLIAESRQLLIVAQAGLSSRAVDAFKPALKSAPQLCIRGGQRMEDRYGALVSQLLRRVRVGTLSLDRARSRARLATHEPELRAQAEAQLLFAHQRFDEAWRTIEPHLGAYGNAPAAICLGVARIALAAFRHEAARSWLQQGVNAGPRSFADLHSAWQLALELDDKSLSETLFAKFSDAYPNEPIVLQERATRLLGEWRYAEAADYARRAGLHFHAAVWEALAQTGFDLEATLRLARYDEDRAYIHWRAALDAEHRGDLDSAMSLAALVPEASKYHDGAMALRLRVFGRGLLHQQKVTDSDVNDLIPLIVSVARAPQKRAARIAFEDLLEETIGDRTALTLLCTACERLLDAVLAAAERAPRAILFPRNDGEVADPAEVLAFSKELSATAPTDLLMVGRGELPATMTSRATPEMIRAILLINQRMDLTGDGRRIATHRLWEIELICRAVGEPSKDCFAAIQLVRWLARQGDRQSARDLAEEALRALPESQPIYRLWRTGLAWMVFAEAFLWTSNPMAALRCAVLMLASWQSSVRETEVICDALNLLARTYRDLQLGALALRFLDAENRLRTNCGAVELMWQLEALELDLKAQELDRDDRRAWLRHFAALLRTWRQLPAQVERLPVLSRIFSIGRHLRLLGVALPEPLVHELTGALQAEQQPAVEVLRHAITEPPTRVEFLAIVERFDSAVRTDDLKTQFSALRMVAEDTIGVAVDSGDADLFLAALGVLAQPVLSLSAGVAEDPMNADITDLHRHARETMSAMDQAAILDMDSILRRAGRPREKQILEACTISVTQVSALLRQGETVLFLAHSGRGQLCACAVDFTGGISLWTAPEESWSEFRFHKWQLRFPSEYRFDAAPYGNGWSRTELRETVKGLGLYLPTRPTQLTIVPSADLFLFPFVLAAPWRPLALEQTDSFLLAAASDEFLGESVMISTAPSPQWLITRRATSLSNQKGRLAWIGTSDTPDQALRNLRETLKWQFQTHGIQRIEADRPTAMVGAGLAIVIAHGVQGEGSEFHALGDGINRFSPVEVASWLEKCACAVIAACHGGASTAHRHTHETRGLVSAILLAGARAVVACPWPLSTAMVAVWLPRFLQSIAAGETVTEAAFAAAKEVRSNFADGAAGAAMQVFGDGNITVSPASPDAD